MTTIQKLIKLKLKKNQFQKTILNLTSNTLQNFNISNNQLQNPIPTNLTKFNSNTFTNITIYILIFYN